MDCQFVGFFWSCWPFFAPRFFLALFFAPDEEDPAPAPAPAPLWDFLVFFSLSPSYCFRRGGQHKLVCLLRIGYCPTSCRRATATRGVEDGGVVRKGPSCLRPSRLLYWPPLGGSPPPSLTCRLVWSGLRVAPFGDADRRTVRPGDGSRGRWCLRGGVFRSAVADGQAAGQCNVLVFFFAANLGRTWAGAFLLYQGLREKDGL